jgi:hypothetical protein
MSWRALTQADLQTAISNTEWTAYTGASLPLGVVDQVAATLAEVTDLVRGYIPTRLGQPGTIPQRLVSAAVDIAVVRFFGRVNVDPGDNRRYLREQAVKLLESVNRQTFRIEDPTDPDLTETPATITPQISERYNPFSFCKQDGL